MSVKPKIIRGGHVYTFGGHNYPSATTVLSRTETPENTAYLDTWKKRFNIKGFKDAEDYRDYTSIRGTFVHYNVINSVAGFTLDASDLPEMSRWHHRHDMLIGDIDRAMGLWKDLGLKLERPIIAETAIYHPERRYAGTPDIVAKLDGEMVLIDLKTSRGVRDKHALQIGAYAQILNRDNPRRIKTAYLIYLHPELKEAIIVEISGGDLTKQIAEFNQYLEKFWKIPGVKKEFGLL